MPRQTEATLQQAIAAAQKGKGKTSLVAHFLGVSGETVRNYRKRWATFDAAIKEARADFDDSLLDNAEVKLEQAVLEGEAWAVKYALSTKGKARGYVERQELTGADGDGLHVTLSWGDDASPDD